MLPSSPVLPTTPLVPESLGMSSPFRDWLTKLVKSGRDTGKELERVLGSVIGYTNSLDTVGATLASAATVTISARIHPVTGAVAITRISASPDFSGAVTLVALGAWTLAVGGNIAKAAAPAIGQIVILVYNPATQTWYPSI